VYVSGANPQLIFFANPKLKVERATIKSGLNFEKDFLIFYD